MIQQECAVACSYRGVAYDRYVAGASEMVERLDRNEVGNDVPMLEHGQYGKVIGATTEWRSLQNAFGDGHVMSAV